MKAIGTKSYISNECVRLNLETLFCVSLPSCLSGLKVVSD